ncbi:MAG: IMP dehydrogenase, partial [Actinomycetota bacterium]|nr:IMP dehydrogenase [Actinomycetota bacterium]
MAEVEIGIGKSGRRAYGFADVALVPSRRTRDPEDVDLSWEIDAFTFDLPVMAAAMDGVVSPATAVKIGELGGVGVLNLEGVWTRYDDPEPLLAEISQLPDERATRRIQEIYAEPIKPELIGARIKELRAGGVVSCASMTPQRIPSFAQQLLDAEL